MEESRKKTSTARAWLVVVAACLIMFTPTYAQMQMSPIAGQLMETYSINEAQYMSVFMAPNMMPIFLAFVAGILLDRFGSKKCVLVAIAITFIGCVARVFAVGYVPFYCTSIMVGFANSFITTGSTKIMSRFFPVDKIGLPMGVLYAASSVATLIATATTAYFPSTMSAFIVSAVVAGIAVAAWAFLVPGETKEEIAGGDQADCPKIGESLKSVLTCKDVYLALIAITCLGVMGFTIAGMLPTAMGARGMSVTDAASMASIYSIGSLVGAIATPAVTQRVKNEKVFIIALAAVLIVLFPCIWIVPVGPALWVVLVVVGLLSYGLTPVMLSLPVRFEKVGVQRAATANGLITTVQSAGITFLPGNVIIPLAGGNYLMLFVILAILAAIVLVCTVFMKIPKPQAAPGE